MTKFSDIPYFLLNKYFEMLDNYKFNKIDENTFCYLIGPRTSIVSKGDNVVELFIKKDGYKSFWITLNSIENNNFSVHKNNQINSPVYDYELLEDDYYVFKIFNLSGEKTFLENGESVYFRKDSLFHIWLKEYALSEIEDYKIDFILRNYVNTDKNFIYFGEIYNKENDNYNIIYYGMKDFVTSSIPDHQRTPKFKELIDINFDLIYNEIHSLHKNLYSLIDPFEIDDKYLNSLSYICGINIDDLDINILNKRIFVNELIHLLKKKGTYSALYSIWKILSGNKSNLHFYEKWHDKDIDGVVSEYELYPWLGYYNKEYDNDIYNKWIEKYYPNQYPINEENKVLSTHYTVEIDLTKDPIHKTEIFNKSFSNKLFDYWEKFRPINRVADYNIFISPIVDLSTKEIDLYSKSEILPFMKSKCNIKNHVLPNSYIQVFKAQGENTELIINHNLGNKFVNIQLFSFNLELIYPDDIIFINEQSVKIIISSNELICVLIKKPNYSSTKSMAETGTGLDEKYLQSLFIQGNESVNPDVFTLLDKNTINVQPILDDGSYSKQNYVHNQTDLLNVWTVIHALPEKEVLVNIYDENNNKIYPNKIELHEYYLNVYFDIPIKGYAVVTQTEEEHIYYSLGFVSNWTINHNINKEYLNVQIYSTDMNEIIPNKIKFINKNSVNIELENPENIFVVIRESDNQPGYLNYWYISHNLNNQYVLSQYSNIDNKYVIPNEIKLVDINTIRTDLSHGTGSVLKNDILYSNFTPSNEWIINHDLGYKGILINIYNELNEKIYPKSIDIINENSLKVSFEENVIGYALIIPVGSPAFIEILNSNIVTFCDDLSEFEFETNITEIWEDNNFIYFRIDIPKEIKMNINKILISNDNQILFETNNSNLYKPNTMSMNIFYRISKEIL